MIPRPYPALATALTLGFVLAACNLGAPPPPAPAVAASEPEPAATLPPPPPRKPPLRSPVLANLPPGTASERVSAPEERPLGPVPETVAAPPPQAGSFDRLIGLDQPHVMDLLGDPRSRAESPPATIWRYAGRNCELDVYFYLDLQSQAMRALHYEVRSHDSPDRSAQRCYGDVVQRRAQTESAGGTDRPR